MERFIETTTGRLETTCAVVVFAKVPGKGRPKSRIAEKAGREKADAIYSELLMITADRVATFNHFVSYSGDDDPGVLKQIFTQAAGFIRQQGDTLGARLIDALCAVRQKGYALLCAVGTDCPELEKTDITSAFTGLAQGKDVVIGPAHDGGYYLIAVKNPAIGVFNVTGWGTADLLTRTVEEIYRLGLDLLLLKEKSDIDTLDDYSAWKMRNI